LQYDLRRTTGYPPEEFSNPEFDSTPQKVPLSLSNIKAVNAVSVANYNERIRNEKEVMKKKQQTAKFKPPSRPSKASEKEGGKTIKRKTKRNNSKKGGSRKKRTTRKNRK
jgi:hypothetical protein